MHATRRQGVRCQRIAQCRHRAKGRSQHPPKANRKEPIRFCPFLHRALNLVECFFNRVKQYRRIATRHDKLAENYLAALKLVEIRIWLRGNGSKP
ncbi:transposase [Aminobacter sp. BA135]